jgi:RNase H-fold protein (predicted Holliday junction resolvase)
MKIVSIDPGTVNLGYAVYEDGKLTQFGSLNILVKKYKTDYPMLVHLMLANHPKIFENLDIILIENQMQAKMKMIACALRCFYWGKSVPISPKAVRNHFKISNSNYRMNKKASIQKVKDFLTKTQISAISNHKKMDDIADAVIQLQYYLSKHKK